MKNNLTKAIDILTSGQYTCVLCKEDEIYTSTDRGVKPLLDWIDSGMDLKGFSAADKVVGKAAAFLYVLLGVKEVYANVMSEAAIYTLSRNGIHFQYDISAKNIINRAGTGNCPMEETVWDISDPMEALEAIKNKLSEMRSVKSSDTSKK